MTVRKFSAASAREALRKVKETLGPDAIILANRGMPGGGVEIMAVAARDMAAILPQDERPASPAASPAPRPAPSARKEDDIEDDYRVSLSRSRRESLAGYPPATPALALPANGRARMERPAFNAALLRQATHAARPAPGTSSAPIAPPSATPRVNTSIPMNTGLKEAKEAREQNRRPRAPQAAQPETAEIVPAAVIEEIRALKKIVEQHLAGFAWGETAKREPVKTEVLRQMLDAGFSPRFARELLLDLPPDLDPIRALAWARGVADRSLSTLSGENDIVEKGGVYALLGPTGVGKTTTVAKLAARSVLRHGAGKVALVTTDSYRIGAYEQLRIYGRILGITVHLARDAGELHQALGELATKHMVLVDTMGMSQKDRHVLELNAMLAECAVRRLLLIAATSRGDTQDDVVRAYRGSDLAGVILTKVDEAASLAPALDAIMRHGLTLHYVTNGQRVPEDLHLPNRAYLLHRAFKEVPEAAHRYDGVEPGLMMANAGLLMTRRPS
jgi:flagellar biosynthesis protein FlhF